jgi:hypothetical protein
MSQPDRGGRLPSARLQVGQGEAQPCHPGIIAAAAGSRYPDPDINRNAVSTALLHF